MNSRTAPSGSWKSARGPFSTPPCRSSSKTISTPWVRRWSSAAAYSSCGTAKAWCTPPWLSCTGLIGGGRLTRIRQVPAASRNTMSPRGTVIRCRQPTTSVMLKCATDLIATIAVLPDCIDRRNLVIASEAKQSRAAGQRGRWARDCMAAIRDLDEAREHHFGQHDTVDPTLFHAGLAVIAAIYRHHEVERGKREQPLAAPPDTAYPMERLRRRANGDIAHVPVIAVAATAIDRDHGSDHAFHPLGRHHFLAIPHATREGDLADLQHVARQQSQTRRGTRLAVTTDGPFAGAKAHRLEQHAAGIVVQLLAGALGNQPAENRRSTAAIGPFYARLAYDRALENEAETIGRRLHCVLAVAQVAVGNGELVPLEAERHAEYVVHRQAIAAGLLREVSIIGELIVELSLGWRHIAVRERDPV